MRFSIFSTVAALIFIVGASVSTPALSAGAREALGGLTSADDAVTHDNGSVSICKGGKFPGCKGGRAFHCPVGGECTETPQGFIVPTATDHSTSDIMEAGPDQPPLFDIGFVNVGRLQDACRLVEGDFQRTASSHSCANPECSKSEMACVVLCKDGKCQGGMPGKPSGPLTLLGILQNGDGIDRSRPSAGGGDSGGDEGNPEEPECGIGGCGTIF